MQDPGEGTQCARFKPNAVKLANASLLSKSLKHGSRISASLHQVILDVVVVHVGGKHEG